MKTSLYKCITIKLILLLIVHSCVEYKEPTELPPETQTGENILGCYVNDELLVSTPRSSCRPYPRLEATYYKKTNRLEIFACGGQKGMFSFCTRLLDPIENNKLMFRDAWYYDSHGLFNNPSYPVKSYDKIINGEIILTRFDTTNLIVSGIFACELSLSVYYIAPPHPADSIVQISQGRFDLKLQNNYHNE